MGKEDLRLEFFASDREVAERSFHKYKLKTQQLNEEPNKVIRSACGKLRNRSWGAGIYENGENIFSLEEIKNIPDNVDFELEYLGLEVVALDKGKNNRVYEGYIESLIKEQLKKVTILDKYKKYSYKDDITSVWFKTPKGQDCTMDSRDKSIRLERVFNIRVEISDDKKARLWINTRSQFQAKLTVADMLEKKQNVLGLEVKNEWSNFRQTGMVVEVGAKTVIEPQDFSPSLKEYYISKGEEQRVKDIADDTPVISVQTRNGSILPYYPQALKPILTREKVESMDPAYSKQIDDLVKRNMVDRLSSDRELIEDIGGIEELGGLRFECVCCDLENIGYKSIIVDLPKLLCGDGRIIDCGNEYQIFNHGFYQVPDKQLKVGYLYPRGEKDSLDQVANDIFSFVLYGKYHGEKDKYIKQGLMNLQVKPEITQPYDIGNITDYKRAALQLKNVDKVDIVIAIIPDGMDEDSPYNPFKKTLAEMNIPSQMVSLKTARKFMDDAKSGRNDSKYYLQNIVLGILGKTGGIPWVVNKMPGNVDCFVGLDVATVDKGIHYPACSVVFDKFGRMLGFFKPKLAQQGEKITRTALQDIFDQVILSYENDYGVKPSNIVIHRDGFSHEDEAWYEHYFATQGIAYSIVEVRKNIYRKMLDISMENMNPVAGACIYESKKREAYLVSTIMKNRKGSPNPLKIEIVAGDIAIGEAVTQILYLTQLHVGSTQKMRLPVTTGYADKICKNLDYVPTGQVENKLFFL